MCKRELIKPFPLLVAYWSWCFININPKTSTSLMWKASSLPGGLGVFSLGWKVEQAEFWGQQR